MIEDFINQMRKIWGFSEEEIRYAIKQVYSKRVKRHEHVLQLFLTYSLLVFCDFNEKIKLRYAVLLFPSW
jgi:hypothetical protein